MHESESSESPFEDNVDSELTDEQRRQNIKKAKRETGQSEPATTTGDPGPGTDSDPGAKENDDLPL